MNAIVQDRYGGSDTLQLRQIEPPAIGDDQVLVRQQASSINAADAYIMRGRPYVLRAAFGWRGPRHGILGRDVAGTVVAVGAKVIGWQPGDGVVSEMERAFAEFVRVPAKLLARKPAGLGFEQAAALPLAGVTALQGLRDAGRLQPGQRVLVNGASGGVGSLAVQLAKVLGAGEVTGVCSAAKADLVRSLGADRVIDHTQEDFTAGGRRYDLIFDLAGRQSLTAARRALTPRGTLVLSSGNGENRWLGPIGRLLGAAVTGPFLRQRLQPLVASSKAEDLATLLALAADGKLRAPIDRSYPLAQAAEAMRYFESGQVRGKVVITM